jgi:hypothetical protein
MDGDQFTPPPPPPEPPERRATGVRKVAATALVCAGLLAGSGIGGYAIAHAASSSTTPASTSATTTTAATSTPTPSASKTPATTHQCPNMGGSTGTSG